MAKRYKLKKRIVAVRCRWCGKQIPVTTNGARVRKHKADRNWSYRDDNLCPGSNVLVKHIPPIAVSTHPRARKK